jgi:hypothetical protein
MKQSGRASLLSIVAIVCVFLIGAMLLMGRESLSSIGGRFMEALQKGDVDTLTKMSYLDNTSEDQMRKEWQFATQTAGKYYAFLWSISATHETDPRTGSVQLSIVRNFTNPGSYPENFQLPLVKVGDDWKVDVKGISRDMYPGLPRG